MSMTSLVQRLEAGGLRLVVPRGLAAFLTVGVLGLTTDLVLVAFGEGMGFPLWATRAVSIPLATLVTWTLNRRHTFGASGLSAHQEALRYFAVAAVAQSVNYGVGLGVQEAAPHLPHVVDGFVGSVVATLFSYTGQRFFTFGRSERA